MSKFAKRLRKIAKLPRNAILLGNAFGHLDDVCESVSSAFIIGTVDYTLNRKNLIFRETIEDFYDIPNVDIIFVDINQADNLRKLQPVWKRFNPMIIVEGSEMLEHSLQKFLKSERYRVVEIRKGYHIWMIG